MNKWKWNCGHNYTERLITCLNASQRVQNPRTKHRVGESQTRRLKIKCRCLEEGRKDELIDRSSSKSFNYSRVTVSLYLRLPCVSWKISNSNLKGISVTIQMEKSLNYFRVIEIEFERLIFGITDLSRPRLPLYTNYGPMDVRKICQRILQSNFSI